MKPQNIRISDMSDSKVLAIANDCTELSSRDLIDLYLDLDRRFHLLPLDDDDFDTFIERLEQVDSELLRRVEQ